MILSNVSNQAMLDYKKAAEKWDELVFDCIKTEIPWITSLIILHECEKHKLRTAILLISQMWKYKDIQIEDPWLQYMLELTNKQTSFILWASTDFVNMMPISKYTHRGLQVSKEFRENHKWIWSDLFNAHNRMNEHSEEITIVPSILLFYINKWYQITNIYTPNLKTYTKFNNWDTKDKYLWYTLDTFEKQNRVYNVLLQFLESGDIWLPFFVKLEKKENSVNYEVNHITWANDFEELMSEWKKIGGVGIYPIVNRKFRREILKIIWLKPQLKDWFNK